MNRISQIITKNRMNTLYLSWVLIYFHMILIIDALQDMIQDLKLHHVTVITNFGEEKNYGFEYFYQSIVQKVPTVTIDLFRMNRVGDNRTLEMETFKNPRQSTIIIILQGDRTSEFEPMKLDNILSQLAQMSPIQMRPKCLVVFSENSNLSGAEAEDILQHAWSLKFLDFSILRLAQDSSQIDYDSSYIDYDPFEKNFNFGCLRDKSGLFPDKLLDVHGYPLKLMVYNAPPYLIVKDVNDSNLNVDGNAPFIYLKTIAEKLNFTMNFTYLQGPFYEEYVNTSLSVARGETNVTPIAYYFNNHFLELDVLPGRVLEMSKFVVIVPILVEYAVIIPVDAFLYVMSFILIVIIFFVSLRPLKIRSEQWNLMYLFGTLIGTGMSQPLKNIERIIFLTMAILSIIYTNDVFSKITDIKVSAREKEFHSFEDIYDSNIPVYHDSGMTLSYFKNEEYEKFLANSRAMYNHATCIEELISARNAVCTIPVRIALYNVKNNLDAQERPLMKITDLSLGHDFVGFLYEKASPFAEKFNKLMLQLVESAVFPDSEMGKVKLLNYEENSLDLDDTIIKIILLIMLFGLASATITFMYEISLFSMIKKKLKKIFKK